MKQASFAITFLTGTKSNLSDHLTVKVLTVVLLLMSRLSRVQIM